MGMVGRETLVGPGEGEKEGGVVEILPIELEEKDEEDEEEEEEEEEEEDGEEEEDEEDEEEDVEEENTGGVR